MQIKFISERLLFNLKEEHLRGAVMESDSLQTKI